MSEGKPLIMAVGFLLFIGLALPFLLGFVVDFTTIEPSPLVSPLITVVEDGFELSVIPFVDFDDFDINPFAWLGESLNEYLVESLLFLSLLPNFLIATIMILSVLAVLYSIIKLLPST